MFNQMNAMIALGGPTREEAHKKASRDGTLPKNVCMGCKRHCHDKDSPMSSDGFENIDDICPDCGYICCEDCVVDENRGQSCSSSIGTLTNRGLQALAYA